MSRHTEEIEEDFLEVDQSIPGQNYTCISFISPEKVIKQKEVYFMKKFLQDLLTDQNKVKYILNILDIDYDHKKFEEGFKFSSEKINNMLTYNKVDSMVEDFRLTNETKVNDEFDELVDFRTSVRGVKVRGIYDTLKEARVRAKILQRKDPKFNVFVGQVGYWLPWDPASTDNIEAEYQEKQLNELMKNYKVNAESRDIFYQEEKQKKMDDAIKENAKRKKENIEAGNLDPTKEPKGNITEKLGEFRNILDEKDRAFNEMISKDRLNTNTKNNVLQKTTITEDDLAADKKEPSTDILGDDSKFSDPWMQRKTEGNEELPAPDAASEPMSHEANNVTGEDNKLGDVVKNIF